MVTVRTRELTRIVRNERRPAAPDPSRAFSEASEGGAPAAILVAAVDSGVVGLSVGGNVAALGSTPVVLSTDKVVGGIVGEIEGGAVTLCCCVGAADGDKDGRTVGAGINCVGAKEGELVGKPVTRVVGLAEGALVGRELV